MIVFDDADIADAAENIAIGGLLQRRPGLHGRDPGAGRAADRRRLRRRRWPSRPAAPRPACPTTRTCSTGRSTTPTSSTGSAGSSTGCPTTPRCSPAAPAQGERGYFWRADRRRRPAPGRRGHPGRDLRAGHHRAAVQRRGRGGALGQRRRVRAGVVGVDARPRPGDAGLAPARLRLRVGQLPHPARRRDAARRLQALRLRQGPLGVRAGGLHPDQARHAQHRV